MIPPHFTPSKTPDLEGMGGLSGGGAVGRKRGKKGGWGRRGWRGPMILALSRQPARRDKTCRATTCGATDPNTSAPTWRRSRSQRQRGTHVAPPGLARQRLIVARVRMARPNGLCRANKMATRLKLKYY